MRQETTVKEYDLQIHELKNQLTDSRFKHAQSSQHELNDHSL